jgi:ribosome-associated protein
MLEITQQIAIPDEEIAIVAIRAQGAGGQNVNKVASAVHLRFDVQGSSLPEAVRSRVLRLADRRISKTGVIVIKAQEHRTFEKNREAARQRLAQLIRRAVLPTKKRKFTRPTRSAARRRVDRKTRRGRVKQLRRKVAPDG